MQDRVRTTAPFGSWRSPITSDLIVAQSVSLSEVRLDAGDVYWIEGRPAEQGRTVVVRAAGGAAPVDVTPPPFNVRTRVHEYGGGAWTVADHVLYFSNLADGRLYRQPARGGEPEPLTPAERGWRFADGIIDRRRNRWIGVREAHAVHDGHTAGNEPVNTIVAIDLGGLGEPAVLASGHDFYSSPRLSPDGTWLTFLAWDHPYMPWNGTTLHLAALGGDGTVGAPRPIAGGISESIFQPEWSPDGRTIVYASDSSGWWNLYAYDLAGRSARPLAPKAAEFGKPQWVFGLSSYAFAGPASIVCAYASGGLEQLALLDLGTGDLRPLATPFTEFFSIQAENDRVVFCAGAADRPWSIVTLDLASTAHAVLRKSNDLVDRAEAPIASYLSQPEILEFPTAGGKTAFGLFYPPHNPDYQAPPHDKPPLFVRGHGGPTSSASSTLSLAINFWTSRGIAVLDVNYGGSTGFGRAYRERLRGEWGVVDVDDCVNGAKHLARQGRVDGARCVISGPSAGGYTALAALTFRDFFGGGASHYGISDLSALARDTHKFESRYLDWLIGPYPQDEARYRARSPVHHAARLKRPVIFFQGAKDPVVPPNQAEIMVEALRRNGNPVGYFLFAGERHGFRDGANIKRCLDAELYFYATNVFGTGLAF